MSDANPAVPVDEQLVEDSVRFINQKVAEKVFQGSLEIGEYLLVNFFGNDIQLAASPNSAKVASYSALERRSDLGVSRTTLARMVRIAAQERFFKTRRIKTDGLCYAHRIELIKLPNNERKVELTRQCIKESLSSRQLVPLVNEVRQEDQTPQPILPEAAVKKHLAELDRLMDGSSVPVVLHDPNRLKAISRETRERLRQTAAALLLQIPNITRLYEAVVANLDRIAVELEE